jgi:hypothetical protein
MLARAGPEENHELMGDFRELSEHALEFEFADFVGFIYTLPERLAG